MRELAWPLACFSTPFDENLGAQNGRIKIQRRGLPKLCQYRAQAIGRMIRAHGSYLIYKGLQQRNVNDDLGSSTTGWMYVVAATQYKV